MLPHLRRAWPGLLTSGDDKGDDEEEQVRDLGFGGILGLATPPREGFSRCQMVGGVWAEGGVVWAEVGGVWPEVGGV